MVRILISCTGLYLVWSDLLVQCVIDLLIEDWRLIMSQTILVHGLRIRSRAAFKWAKRGICPWEQVFSLHGKCLWSNIRPKILQASCLIKLITFYMILYGFHGMYVGLMSNHLILKNNKIKFIIQTPLYLGVFKSCHARFTPGSYNLIVPILLGLAHTTHVKHSP